MVYLVTIFPVEDYDAYVTELDRSAERFARLDVLRYWIYRASDDGREVLNVFQFPSTEHAKRFLRSPEVDVPRFLDSMTLEIYPTFFLGEQTVYRELTAAPGAASE